MSNNPKARMGALKLPVGYLSPMFMIEMGRALKDGMVKYGPYNWREEPIDASTYIYAIQRHLALWAAGQDYASDSSAHHMAHIASSCNIIIDSQSKGSLIDDRPKDEKAIMLLEELNGQKVDK